MSRQFSDFFRDWPEGRRRELDEPVLERAVEGTKAWPHLQALLSNRGEARQQHVRPAACQRRQHASAVQRLETARYVQEGRLRQWGACVASDEQHLFTT